MSETVSFGDGDHAPDQAFLEGVLGGRARLWGELVALAEAMGAQGGWTWEGPKSGWSWRMKRAGKPFLGLTPRPGGLRALVILGRDQSTAAADLALGARMAATYQAARQYPDGRWLFHDVETDEDVRDVAQLLRLKLPPTVRARLGKASA